MSLDLGGAQLNTDGHKSVSFHLSSHKHTCITCGLLVLACESVVNIQATFPSIYLDVCVKFLCSENTSSGRIGLIIYHPCIPDKLVSIRLVRSYSNQIWPF